MQFRASWATTGSAALAAWVMLRYFTILANLVLAVVFTGVALGKPGRGSPSRVGCVTLSILLVGVIYTLLLRNLVELSGGARTADLLLHHATPILAPLFWLLCARHGALRARDPLIWSLFPLAYFGYALARGAIEKIYAYPFMDAAQIGWAKTGANAAAIAIGFMICGHLFVRLDTRLSKANQHH